MKGTSGCLRLPGSNKQIRTKIKGAKLPLSAKLILPLHAVPSNKISLWYFIIVPAMLIIVDKRANFFEVPLRKIHVDSFAQILGV